MNWCWHGHPCFRKGLSKIIVFFQLIARLLCDIPRKLARHGMFHGEHSHLGVINDSLLCTTRPSQHLIKLRHPPRIRMGSKRHLDIRR